MEQYLPVAIMFLVTVITASLFFVPVTMFRKKAGLVRFYWNGFWIFLALITGFAGASSTLMLLGEENVMVSAYLLNALLVTYVTFVVLGWFHLSGKAVFKFISRAN